MVNHTGDPVAFPFESLGWVIQALGGVAVIYVIFGIVQIILHRRKNKELKKISNDLAEIKKMLSKKGKK